MNHPTAPKSIDRRHYRYDAVAFGLAATGWAFPVMIGPNAWIGLIVAPCLILSGVGVAALTHGCGRGWPRIFSAGHRARILIAVAGSEIAWRLVRSLGLFSDATPGASLGGAALSLAAGAATWIFIGRLFSKGSAMAPSHWSNVTGDGWLSVGTTVAMGQIAVLIALSLRMPFAPVLLAMFVAHLLVCALAWRAYLNSDKRVGLVSACNIGVNALGLASAGTVLSFWARS